METKDIKLPLAYSSHRQIMDADRNLVIEVFSGGPSIEAADQLQELVVVACNSHAALVNALTLLAEKVDAAGGSIFGFADELQHARAALAAAGAA
jgi:hypothetical protein